MLQLLKPGADGNDFWTLRIAPDTRAEGDEEQDEKEAEWLEAVNEEYFSFDASTACHSVFDVIVEKRNELYAVDSDEEAAWE